jgi:predicted ribosomally synthesized peptide with SipW-like signal peptide
MRKMLLSLILIVGAGTVLASGGTGAFFSDTESSTGNTFAAGAIDLKIDNDSWYNGNQCVNVGTSAPDWRWQGNAAYPVPGSPCTTSFPLADLDDGFVFFNFNDVKPDDEGEDTISIHVQNDAWACMDLTLASNDDVDSKEPELADGDVADVDGNGWDGELAQTLEFFWWADDGDNVYESGEQDLSGGVKSLADLATTSGSFSITLADAANNAWGQPDGTPLPANETVYIAKAWCMGDLTLDPVTEGQGVNPGVASGVNCDGTLLDNTTQTDAVEINVSFRAEQARNNPNFLCEPPVQQRTVSLAVNKIITADTVGIGVEDFELHIDGPIPGPSDDQIVGDNVPVTGLPAGTYTVYEVILPAGLPPGVTFTSTIGGACTIGGSVALAPGESKVCTINNVENE